MKAVFISCFNYYDNRIKYIENYLSNKGYQVEYITSDFDHIEKTRYKIKRSKVKQIHCMSYFKNISVRRLLSHYYFSKKAFDIVKRDNPDLLYLIAPPNSLVYFAAKYKKKNNVKLVIDLYDLWPETFPSRIASKLLIVPFMFWGKLRDNYLPFADVVITECDLYQEKLEKNNCRNIYTLYLTKEFKNIPRSNIEIDSGTINICYLGSINNLIDIQLITDLLSAINVIKPVTLYIIGDGESRKHLINTVESKGINVKYCGMIFDETKKQEIFERCLFGINIMKDTVCVGLTMKSIDYFQAGLPILNNIRADTEKIVEQYGIGYNLSRDNIEEVARKVANLDRKDVIFMKDKTRRVFEEVFSLTAFNKKLELIFKDII